MVPKTISLEYWNRLNPTIMMVHIPKAIKLLISTGFIKSIREFFPSYEYFLLGMEAASHTPRKTRKG